MVIDLPERLWIRLKHIGAIIQEPLCDVTQGFIDLGFERIAHPTCILNTRLSKCLDAQISRVKRLTTQKRVDIQKIVALTSFYQFWEIYLIEAIEFMSRA